jgi:uncharacterized protein YggE
MKMFSFITALVLGAGVLPSVAQSVGNPSLQINRENRTITVSASDHAEADPDVADIHIGFTAYGATLQNAYKSASETSNKIVKAMTDAGAKQSDIQSQSQDVSRLSDYEVKEQKGMRFSVQQSWTVSVAPKEAALILDAAVQAGANQSGDINWRLKNSLALDSEAIHRATERARAYAKEIASSLDVKVGQPIYVTNSTSGGIRPMGASPRVFAMAKAAEAPAPLAIQTQRVESNARVEIVFAIE